MVSEALLVGIEHGIGLESKALQLGSQTLTSPGGGKPMLWCS